MKKIDWLKLIKNLLLALAGAISLGTPATIAYVSHQAQQEQATIEAAYQQMPAYETRAFGPLTQRHYVEVYWSRRLNWMPGVSYLYGEIVVTSVEKPSLEWLRENIKPPYPGFVIDTVLTISSSFIAPKIDKIPATQKN